MITELYISLDGENFKKIDMDEDESIVMKYIAKDLRDIAKVFSPFSQDFSFKATTNNQKALGFYGNTSIDRINTENKYLAKIYTNGMLNLTGILQLKTGRYKNNVLETYNASFGTFMTSLKDVIKDDKLNDLGSAIVQYKASDIKSLMTVGSSTNFEGIDIKYFIPFMSNNRVWSYDSVDDARKDNLFYKDSTTVNSDKFINEVETRPAISVVSILNLIKNKYNLNVVSPIENNPMVKDAYIYCNNESFKNTGWYAFHAPNNTLSTTVSSSMTHPEGLVAPYKYTFQSFNLTNSYRITKNVPGNLGYLEHCTFLLQVNNYYYNAEAKGRVRLRNLATNDIIYQEEIETSNNGEKVVEVTITDDLFVGNQLNFVVEMSWDRYVRHSKIRVFMKQYIYMSQFFGGYINGFISTGTSYFFGSTALTTYNKMQIDLLTLLPSTSVLDFLTSYLNSFNIQIYNTRPDSTELFWLTPADLKTQGLEYSKSVVDYTPYLDAKEFTKDSISYYNYYNFKHLTSKYNSNIAYKTAAGLEYGQVVYPDTPPAKPNPYTLETKWSIIPPVSVANSPDMITTYGFNADKPEFTDTENFVYTPNYNELTVFYRPPMQVTTGIFAVTGCLANGTPVIQQLFGYIPALPFNGFTSLSNSLAFSILVFFNQDYPNNLYETGYASDIVRLLNQNCMTHNFTLNLPSNELYLNDQTGVQGGGQTPSGFRLQNDIIIGETRFSIIEASIDQTTGKSSMKLLNYI